MSPLPEVALCCISFAIGVRLLKTDRARAIDWIKKEIETLAQYPTPEVNKGLHLTLSLLRSEERALLQEAAPEIEAQISQWAWA